MKSWMKTALKIGAGAAIGAGTAFGISKFANRKKAELPVDESFGSDPYDEDDFEEFEPLEEGPSE